MSGGPSSPTSRPWCDQAALGLARHDFAGGIDDFLPRHRRRRGPLPQLPTQLQRTMRQDAAQPRLHRARTIERRRLLDRDDERLLHQVLGRMAIAEQMEGEPVELHGTAVEHAAERPGIPGAGVADEGVVEGSTTNRK